MTSGKRVQILLKLDRNVLLRQWRESAIKELWFNFLIDWDTGLLNVGDILSTWFSVRYISRKEKKAENSRTAKWDCKFFFRLLLSNCLNWKFTAMIILHFHLQPQLKISYIQEIWTQQIDFGPNVWHHSSVGRASHRYRGGHGLRISLKPCFFVFFSGFFFPIV